MTRVGIQISSVKSYLQTPQDVFASLEKVSKIGYQLIQIQWVGKDVPPEAVAQALEKNNLICTGTQDYYDEVLDNLPKFICMNRLFGSRDVCFSGIPARYEGMAGLLEMASQMRQTAHRLSEEGMVFSFHPRAQEYALCGGKPALEILLENTPEQIRVVLDISHVIKARLDPIQWIEKLQGRVDYVHFKDAKHHPDGSHTLVPVGQGDTNWEPIFQACRRCGVQVGFAEQESWQKDPFDCLKESYDYIISHGIEK